MALSRRARDASRRAVSSNSCGVTPSAAATSPSLRPPPRPTLVGPVRPAAPSWPTTRSGPIRSSFVGARVQGERPPRWPGSRSAGRSEQQGLLRDGAEVIRSDIRYRRRVTPPSSSEAWIVSASAGLIAASPSGADGPDRQQERSAWTAPSRGRGPIRCHLADAFVPPPQPDRRTSPRIRTQPRPARTCGRARRAGCCQAFQGAPERLVEPAGTTRHLGEVRGWRADAVVVGDLLGEARASRRWAQPPRRLAETDQRRPRGC